MAARPLPVELRFPALPAAFSERVDGSSTVAEMGSYLRRVLDWRRAVLAWINSPDLSDRRDSEGLTERACQALSTFLETEWTPGVKEYARQSPYNLGEFPVKSPEQAGTEPLDALVGILRWRAAVMDYLSDVWDVLGEPSLTLEECSALETFLSPPGMKSLCHLCLRSFPDLQRHPDAHPCAVLGHVRAKWPALPPAFARWAKEARTKQAPAGVLRTQPEESVQKERPMRRRWWWPFCK